MIAQTKSSMLEYRLKLMPDVKEKVIMAINGSGIRDTKGFGNQQKNSN